MSKDIFCVHIHTHIVSLKGHALVCYITLLVAVNKVVMGIEYDRVCSLTLDDVGKCCALCAATLRGCIALGC